MEQEPLCIKDSIQLYPDTLFSLGTKYKHNFNLCELGILYLLDRYSPTDEKLKMSQAGIEYYLMPVSSLIAWFQYWKIYTEKSIRSAISKLVRCGAILMPRGYTFHTSDDAFWFFETDEMWEQLDPVGYMHSKAYSSWCDTYSHAVTHTKKERLPGPEGWVYCFYNSITEYCKIGITKKLDQRKYSLECSSGVPLDFLIAMKCSDYGQCEHKLHVLFSENRKTGEWFSLDKPIRDNMHYYFERTANENNFIISEWKESI